MKDAVEAVFKFSSGDVLCPLLLMATFIFGVLYLRARADLAKG